MFYNFIYMIIVLIFNEIIITSHLINININQKHEKKKTDTLIYQLYILIDILIVLIFPLSKTKY